MQQPSERVKTYWRNDWILVNLADSLNVYVYSDVQLYADNDNLEVNRLLQETTRDTGLVTDRKKNNYVQMCLN